MKNLGIFFTGAATGAIAALLFAPKTGDKTRKMIAKEFDKNMNIWGKKLNEVKEDMQNEYGRTVNSVTKRGKELITDLKKEVEHQN